MTTPTDRELVDVIDDAGRTVAVVTRQEMRRQRLPHRCVYVLVFNRQGELFLHLRTPTKDIYPSHWDVAMGGVLAAGEGFDEGARREVAEELGIDTRPEALFPFHYADSRTVVQAMVYRLDHDGPFCLQPEEIVRGEFRPLDEVVRLTEQVPFCPDGLEVLRNYFKRCPAVGRSEFL